MGNSINRVFFVTSLSTEKEGKHEVEPHSVNLKCPESEDGYLRVHLMYTRIPKKVRGGRICKLNFYF